jgi:hypothetical protein
VKIENFGIIGRDTDGNGGDDGADHT